MLLPSMLVSYSPSPLFYVSPVIIFNKPDNLTIPAKYSPLLRFVNVTILLIPIGVTGEGAAGAWRRCGWGMGGCDWRRCNWGMDKVWLECGWRWFNSGQGV